MFLLVIILENLSLLAIWFIFDIATFGQLSNTKAIIVGIIVVTTLGGGLFLSLYTFCKPKYTDQVVLHDIRAARAENEDSKFINLNGLSSRTWNATKYGIYYEFCDLVFKLPSSNKVAKGLEEIRKLQEPT